MLEALKQTACAAIDNKQQLLSEVSTRLWNHPELALQEHFAHKLLTETFQQQGFSVEKHTPLETSFIARYGRKGGTVVGVCCEYDALPSIGHACGHNLIAETALACAVGVKAFLEEEQCDGEIVVFGTPAEESHGGKVDMIEHGVFNDCDLCMMVHPAPYNIPDPILLAVQWITITYHGDITHGWNGLNAVDAGVLCYTNISMLRQQMMPTTRCHCIVTEGGSHANMVPQRCVLQCMVRGETDQQMNGLLEKVKRCARAASTQTGCKVEISEDRDYSALTTNKPLIRTFVQNAKFFNIDYDFKGSKQGGSSDMGSLSKIKPSIHPKFAINCKQNIHTSAFAHASIQPENQLPTLQAGKCLAMTAIDVLTNEKLREEIKREFNAS